MTGTGEITASLFPGYTVTITGRGEAPETTAADDPGGCQLTVTPGPDAPESATLTFTGMSDPVCWVLARMPDGTCAEGIGTTLEEAAADARRAWRHWERAHAGPLAVDGREYQRRLKARRRRRR